MRSGSLAPGGRFVEVSTGGRSVATPTVRTLRGFRILRGHTRKPMNRKEQTDLSVREMFGSVDAFLASEGDPYEVCNSYSSFDRVVLHHARSRICPARQNRL